MVEGAAAARFESLGLERQQLVSLVDTAFGDPLLVVATGSIAAGFGNPESDVDLYVVVDSDDVIQIPMVIYERGFRVDVRYYSRTEVETWRPLLQSAWPCTPADATEESHGHRRAVLHGAVRFALGWRLMAEPSMADWNDGLREGWLQAEVVRWWSVEALRRVLAARWLRTEEWPARWMRHGEAALAALDCRAARRGELFFGYKWLGQKLVRTGDDAGRSRLRAVLEWVPAERRGEYMQGCEDLVREEAGLPLDGLRWCLRPAKGVEIDDYADRRLVSRWSLRGFDVPRSACAGVLPPPDGRWTGPLDEEPAGLVRRLLEEDLLWMSVVEP